MSAKVKRFKNGELVEEITYTKAQLKKLQNNKNKGKDNEDVFKNEENEPLQEEDSETKG